MKASPFQYHRPDTVDGAIALLAELDNARAIAGGQSLMAMMNMRYVQVDHLVDLNHIDELVGITVVGDRLEIGAMVRQHVLLEDRTVAGHSPLLVSALTNVGHVQTRSRGTIGGSLCHLDPAAELPACLLALDADLHLSGPQSVRVVPIDEWFLGYMTPNQHPEELLTGISIPRTTASCRHSFVEVAQRKGDFAIAAAAALLRMDGERIDKASIVVAGLSTRPYRMRNAEKMLQGNVPDIELLDAAAKTAEDLDIVHDSYSDVSYKLSLGKTLMRRSLMQALGRSDG